MVLAVPGDDKIKITLYGRPVTKKNGQMIIKNKKTGRPIIVQKKGYRDYERDCLKQITGKHKLNISYPVNVKAIYYMPDRRRVDLTNLLEVTWKGPRFPLAETPPIPSLPVTQVFLRFVFLPTFTR